MWPFKRPLKHLRNLLNNKYPPTPTQVRKLAALSGITVATTNKPSKAKQNEEARNLRSIKRFSRVGFGANGQRFFDRLMFALDNAKIGYFQGTATDAWSRSINIHESDAPFFSALLSNWFGEEVGAFARVSETRYVPLGSLRRNEEALENGKFDICVVENETNAAVGRIVFFSTININIWQKGVSYGDRGFMESSVSSPWVRRLNDDHFAQMCEGRTSIEDLEPRIASRVDFPIDVVYTWVDDADPEWREAKQHAAGEFSPLHGGRALEAERFKNRDELKYSLRSIDLYAPFVRNVFLVTCGQVPSWLNTSNERLKVVPHSEIYSNKEHLPTFNSSGIETQLHHIQGLAEHFIYFNDDFFLGSFCTPQDFFYANGVMKYFPSSQRAYEPDIDRASEEYIIADANAIELLKRKYGRFGREIMLHTPYPCRKSLLDRLEREFQAEFDRCAASKFRAAEDLRPIAFMQYHAAFDEGLAIPSSISHRYLGLWKATIGEQMNGVETSRKYKTFCINDVGIRPENQAKTDALVRSFLENYFPLKSAFER